MADANDPVVTKSILNEVLRESSKFVINQVAGIIRDFSDRADESFNKIEVGIVDLNTKYDQLFTILDDQDQENVALYAHIERLDRWIHKVTARSQMELSYCL